MAHIQPNIHIPKTPKIEIYTANIGQGGGTPTINQVFHNTTGAIITLTADGTGIIKLTAYKPIFKYSPIQNWMLLINNMGGNNCITTASYVDESNLRIYQYTISTPHTLTDDLLAQCIIELRIYTTL